MATRSLIGRLNADGTVTAVYCHWDGYIEEPGVGFRLLNEWTDPIKIDAMMALGDMSSLGAEIGDAHDFNARDMSDVCTFYGRDRGETGVDARSFSSADAYWTQKNQTDAEYLYLFVDGEWLVKPRTRAVQPLADHYLIKRSV